MDIKGCADKIKALSWDTTPADPQEVGRIADMLDDFLLGKSDDLALWREFWESNFPDQDGFVGCDWLIIHETPPTNGRMAGEDREQRE